MLITSIISLIISTMIQGTTSNILNYLISNLSILYTSYILINLIIIMPYFENKNKYIIILIIFGLIIDIAYTNTFILNTVIFIALYLLNKIYFKILPYNLFTINISSLLSVIMYHIISFTILSAINYDNYNIIMLLKVISHSILMTIIYTTILYLIINYIYKKFELRNVK